MDSNNNTRLNTVLRKLNISLDTAVEYFKSIGIEINTRPTAKLTEQEVLLLNNKFEKVKFIRTKGEKINKITIKNIEKKKTNNY